jgi:pSer/pThr/pTyr-binding forkhead associated (FHA) protein/tetratricopeptide (TPR) repeat protein
MAESFPKLVVLTGPEEGSEVSLKEDEVLKMGRSDDNGLVLKDSSVSRHHAMVLFRDGQYHVQDLESRNGTFFNGEKVTAEKDVALEHLSEIKLGLYEIRFLEKEAGPKDWILYDQKKEEQETGEQEQKTGEEEKGEQEKRTGEQEVGEQENKTEEQEIGDQEREAEEQEKVEKKMKPWVIGAAVVTALLLVSLVVWLFGFRDDGSSVVDEDEVLMEELYEDSSESEPVSEKDPETPEEMAVTALKSDDSVKPENVWSSVIDIKSEPIPATVFINGKRLSLTPIKERYDFEKGKTYEVMAEFELPDIKDVYQKKMPFTPNPREDVQSLTVQANIGQVKVLRLPLRSKMSLEGYYDYDVYKTAPVSLSDVDTGKAIHLPYGKYRVELREEERVSGSENPISRVKYQREYTISADQPSVEVRVSENDLKIFPAVIKSDPTRADVYDGAKLLGRTPLQIDLPVGRNQLVLKKEGYFDYTLDIDMPLNSLYETNVTLSTSTLGEFIQRAKTLMNDEKYSESKNVLEQALTYGGSPTEKAEVYWMLGKSYFFLNELSKARSNFLQARQEPDFLMYGTLGLAQVLYAEKNEGESLNTLVEVLANIDKASPKDLRTEAYALFKQISPVQAVVLITSQPTGANVYFNDRKLEEKTPLILSKITFGNFRLEIEHPGYESFKYKANLKIGEFTHIRAPLKKIE